MNKSILPFLLVWITGGLIAQTTHVVQQVGFTYSPETVNIKVGDSVRFEGEANHPFAQVSETTWNNNGSTPLTGGFAFASGSGKVGFTEEGTFYYVCTAHVASNQMKGKIVVSTATSIEGFSGSDFKVYPVPLTGNELTIELKSQDQRFLVVDIFDLSGRIVLKSIATASNGIARINCEKLNKGVFLLRIFSGEETLYTKFSK